MMACSSKPSVSTRIWRFFPLTFCPRHSHADRCKPPFFSALHALAIDDGGGRAGFSFALLSTRHIKRVMDAIQRAVVAPQVEIVEKCAAWRQIFRDRTPLASRAQNIHDPLHHFAHLDMALVAAALGGRDQWFDMRPFSVGQVTRISQFAAVVTSAVLRRPHRNLIACYRRLTVGCEPKGANFGLRRICTGAPREWGLSSVRFASRFGLKSDISRGPSRANSGLMQRSKQRPPAFAPLSG